MTFSDRYAVGTTHETNVADRLRSIGWRAFAFGQAQLPDECRRYLKHFEDDARRPSLLRWMPDILAFRVMPTGRTLAALIDAKCCGVDTPNYAIEWAAIETCELCTERLYTPTFFVFDDWKVLTPRDARQRGRQGPDARPGYGSGTPYVLVPKWSARLFDDVFQAATAGPPYAADF